VDSINVLITGCGAPGIKGTLYSLENNFDGRKIRTIGTDIKDEVVGKYLCNRFYKISKPSSPKYLADLLSICKEEAVQVLLPQNTAELSVLAEHKADFEAMGTTVAVSDKSAVEIANNKYELMKKAQELGVPLPSFHLANNFDDLQGFAQQLGWPNRPVIVKPPISNGMRGLRIIDESINLKRFFLQREAFGGLLEDEESAGDPWRRIS